MNVGKARPPTINDRSAVPTIGTSFRLFHGSCHLIPIICSARWLILHSKIVLPHVPVADCLFEVNPNCNRTTENILFSCEGCSLFSASSAILVHWSSVTGRWRKFVIRVSKLTTEDQTSRTKKQPKAVWMSDLVACISEPPWESSKSPKLESSTAHLCCF